MFVSRKILSLAAALLAAFMVMACGGSQKTAEHVDVKHRAMPDGASWSGVYYSQTYGNLHLVEEGGTVNGRWRTTSGDRWGELAGEAKGDLLEYEWTEHKIGMVGPSASTKGRGYFRFIPSDSGIDPPTIKGQWGMGDKNAGNTWEATKQRNVAPNPKSVEPDEIERRGEGGGWDEGGGPQRTAESESAFGTGGGAEPAEEEEAPTEDSGEEDSGSEY